MSEMDNKTLNQLLLSPLFLFEQLLSIVLPGALLMLLLALKGNLLLRSVWNNSPFGYKTKIAAFLVLSYVVGTMVKLPLYFLLLFRKKQVNEMPAGLKEQSPAIQKMFSGMISDGVILATPGLLDRLSLAKTDATFHLGIGTALMIAAMVPGDGLRLLEALVGLAMLCVGIWKSKQYQDQVWQNIGIGWANVFARISPEQLRLAAAVVTTLKLDGTEKISGTTDKPAEPSALVKSADAVITENAKLD